MGAAIERDRADRSAAIHAEESGFSVDEGANQKVILPRTRQRQCFKAGRRSIRNARGLRCRRTDFRRREQSRDKER